MVIIELEADRYAEVPEEERAQGNELTFLS